ncbi:MAG: hypothetical protein J5842_05520 [Lachnospiraceae bacterium]|nr:hypothetical protein [Lachnospiraceae bacterium]
MVEHESYKKVFDAIDTHPEITVDSLMKRKRDRQKHTVKKTIYTAFVFSLLFLGSNVITYAQSGEPWIAKVLSIKTGNGVNITIKDYEHTDPNVAQCEVTINTNDQTDYCKTENGRVIFTFEDKQEDITDYCDQESYYKYEYSDESGYRHLILAGGSIDNPGWAEYIFDEQGICAFNLMSDSISYSSLETAQSHRITVIREEEAGSEESESSENVFVYNEDDPIVQEPDLPEWLEKAEKQLGIGDHIEKMVK